MIKISKQYHTFQEFINTHGQVYNDCKNKPRKNNASLNNGYKTHYNVVKIILGKKMSLTQQWLQDPLQCCETMPRKNNSSHSTMAIRPITMLPKQALEKQCLSLNNGYKTHYNVSKTILGKTMPHSTMAIIPITNMCNIIIKENSIIIILL
jgi:hypothetical protein